MNTFIIPWDPTVSNYTLEQLQRDLPNPDYGDFSWPTEGLEKVQSGDNFYLVCEKGEPFIVMRGFFLDDPVEGNDSVALRPTFISWPTGDAPRFLMDTLDREILGFNWRLYAEGNPLPDWAGKKLSALFDHFLGRNVESLLDGQLAECSHKPAANVDDAIEIAAEAYCDEMDPLDGRPAIISILRPALKFKKDESIICAALRDIIGRCGWTPGKLREWGFSEAIVDILVLLRRKEGEKSEDYLLRTAQSKNAIVSLIAAEDLKDKIDRSGR